MLVVIELFILKVTASLFLGMLLDFKEPICSIMKTRRAPKYYKRCTYLFRYWREWTYMEDIHLFGSILYRANMGVFSQIPYICNSNWIEISNHVQSQIPDIYGGIMNGIYRDKKFIIVGTSLLWDSEVDFGLVLVHFRVK